MESPDHKPPPAAVPKRPTLLNAGVSSAAEPTPSTSMLASLERDVPRQGTGSVRRAGFRGKGGVAVLAGLVLCGAAAFYALGPSKDAFMASAPAAPSVATATAESTGSKGVAGPVAAGAASMPVSATWAPARSASSAQIELAAANGVAAADAVPEQDANRAPGSGRNPLDKLALTGADATAASAAAAVSTKKKSHDKVAAKSSVAGAAVASAKGGEVPLPTARNNFRGEMDADTELVAAMMARLDRRGAKPPVVATASSSVTKEDDKALSGMVRECGLKADLLDARRCRNRVCEKQWGKADACPASRAPKGSLGAGPSHGKPG